uniref:Desmoplakin n=1 Tax=Chrysodeixis includens nucleopolyhedrovirus TaxID=1207438 RepID=A0A1C8ZYL3_9ABAC|nr:desmoplakin [Chrysodeixis includens nucleopolyhedrovirus]AOL57202.1 desmoplakin [Chrysodeixis includens nucleopolyhedrovirus]QGW49190.1 desmoplakin [Chrysodeixis includens nucleopolyhedrovirus]QGW49470.1 desmoplakin [Chrysodeixis includens nucleopolyhedrovirus]QGW49610.1 desmoplakin [Chrysodeixis includens nucleopolyhedrovirus]
MNRYRPKYKNTEVNADTVQNLLRTINTMSQRCKTQSSTDDVLQRVRSIILLHRPDLITRVDLQIPELVTEALIPSSNQITHNFNYKYDYNSNVPNPPIPPPINPFTANSSGTMYQFDQKPLQPVQMFTFNQTPSTTMAPPSQSNAFYPQQMSTESTPSPPNFISISEEDSVALNESYQQSLRSPSIESYKRLISLLVVITRKYIRSDVFIVSLNRLESFDSLLSSDLQELMQCIQRNTNWSMGAAVSTPELCQLISIIVKGYCRLANTVLKSTSFDLSSVGSVESLQQQVVSIQNQLSSIVSVSDTAVANSDQIIRLNNQMEMLQSTLVDRESTIMTLNTNANIMSQRNQALESNLAIIQSSYNSLARALDVNINTSARLENSELVEATNRIIQNKIIEDRNLLKSFESDKQTNVQSVNRLERELNDSREYVNKLLFELNAARDDIIQLKEEVNRNVSTQRDESNIKERQQQELLVSELFDLREENKSNQSRIASMSIELMKIADENKNLKDKLAIREKPTARAKPYNRPSQSETTSAAMENRTRALQKTIKDLETSNQQLRNQNSSLSSQMKKIKQSGSTKADCSRIKSEVDNVRQKVEELIKNQATLNLQDINALNQKTADYYNTKLSELTSENQSMRDILNTEMNKQIDVLNERIDQSKSNILDKIERLSEEFSPILVRAQASENYVQSLLADYESLSRNVANQQLSS